MKRAISLPVFHLFCQPLNIRGWQNITVSIVVVLDDCSDQTKQIVSAHGVSGIEVSFKNVGKARATGADHLLTAGAKWLAFTDADTVVPRDWLARQIEFKADAVCGTVEVDSWNDHESTAPILA